MVYLKRESYSQLNNYVPNRPTVFERFLVVPDRFKTDGVSWGRACGRSCTNQMKVKVRSPVVKSEQGDNCSPIQNKSSLNYPWKRMVIKNLLLDESALIK